MDWIIKIGFFAHPYFYRWQQWGSR